MGWLKYAIAFAATAYLSFKLGVLTGEANSPDYSSETSNMVFIITNATVRETRDRRIVATVRAGWTDYLYDDSVRKVVARPRFSELAKGYKPPKRWRSVEYEKLDALTGVAAVAEGGLIGQLARKMKAGAKGSPKQWQVIAVMTAGLFTGGIVGYHVGYKDEMDYDGESFKKTVMDVKAWRFVVSKYEDCKLSNAILETFERQHTAAILRNEVNEDIQRILIPRVIKTEKEKVGQCRSTGQFPDLRPA